MSGGTKTVLFVCAANRARSPIATAILRQRVDDLDLPIEVEVSSAGLCAAELERIGLPAEESAARVAAECGFDLSDHIVRAVALGMIEENDLIVVMEEWQRKILATARPEASEKILRLHQLAGDESDAPDIARLPDRDVREFLDGADRTITASLDDGYLARLLR